MKQVNFSHPGGFPLEQETLEKLQTAYRSELYEAIKSHLSIIPNKNYIITHAQDGKQGWAVIHQDSEGILYPIKAGPPTSFLKTTKTVTDLIYGDGASQTAYSDYAAEYAAAMGTSTTNGNETVKYYDLKDFETVKSIKSIENDINLINKSYLPLDGSKAMQGDLNLGDYHLSKLDTLENFVANVRAADFKFGSEERRGILHPEDHLGRALVDSSDETKTNLTLNHASDWQNTTIGGKLYLDNLNTNTTDFIVAKSSANSLLLIDDAKQVTKSNNLLNSLLNRIAKLEEQPNLIPGIQLSISNLKESLTTVDGRVQKVEEKLNTIENGAQKNVQADFNVVNTSSDAFIKNKPNLLNLLYMGSIYIGNITENSYYKVISFPNVGTTNYQVVGSLRSNSTNLNIDNNVFHNTREHQATSFKLCIREMTNDDQDISFDYFLVKQ